MSRKNTNIELSSPVWGGRDTTETQDSGTAYCDSEGLFDR